MFLMRAPVTLAKAARMCRPAYRAPHSTPWRDTPECCDTLRAEAEGRVVSGNTHVACRTNLASSGSRSWRLADREPTPAPRPATLPMRSRFGPRADPERFRQRGSTQSCSSPSGSDAHATALSTARVARPARRALSDRTGDASFSASSFMLPSRSRGSTVGRFSHSALATWPHTSTPAPRPRGPFGGRPTPNRVDRPPPGREGSPPHSATAAASSSTDAENRVPGWSRKAVSTYDVAAAATYSAHSCEAPVGETHGEAGAATCGSGTPSLDAARRCGRRVLHRRTWRVGSGAQVGSSIACAGAHAQQRVSVVQHHGLP